MLDALRYALGMQRYPNFPPAPLLLNAVDVSSILLCGGLLTLFVDKEGSHDLSVIA